MLKDRKFLFFLLFGIALFFGAYSNHFYNSFHFDDAHVVRDNPFIRSLDNIPLFFKDANTMTSLSANVQYRPILPLSLAIDYAFQGGLHPTFYFHLSTFLVLILFLCLSYFWLAFILNKNQESSNKNNFIALLMTLFLGLNTIGAETINYICQRVELYSTFMVLLALFLAARNTSWNKLWAFIPLTIGVLSKVSAIVFGPLLVVYLFWFQANGSFKTLLQQKFNLWLIAMVALFSLLVLALVLKMNPDTYIAGGIPLGNYVITQVYVWFHYFSMMILPTGLSADTDLEAFSSVWDGRFFIGLLFLGALFMSVFLFRKNPHWRLWNFGVCWFVITLLPTSLVSLSETMNDHRMYFAFPGFVMMLANVVQYFRLNDKKWFVALFVLVLMGHAYGIYARNKVWSTEESLWKDVSIKSPKNGRGLMNYGLALMAKGDQAGAEHYFLEALKYTPNYSYLYVNLGVLYAGMDLKEKAEPYFKKAVDLAPGLDNSYFFYGRSLLNWAGRESLGEELLLKSIKLNPYHLQARYLLLQHYYNHGLHSEMKALAQSSSKLIPEDPTIHFYLEASKDAKTPLELALLKVKQQPDAYTYLDLSLHYYNAGDFQQCIASAEKSLQYDPDYALAYNNICSAYNAMGMYQKGIRACEKALLLSPNFELATNNLNWAKSQLNR